MNLSPNVFSIRLPNCYNDPNNYIFMCIDYFLRFDFKNTIVNDLIYHVDQFIHHLVAYKEHVIVELLKYFAKETKFGISPSLNISHFQSEKYITSLLKRLKGNNEKIKNILVTLISRGGITLECIPIKRNRDGRLQTNGAKHFPHLLSVQLWRHPAILTKHDLIGTNFCKYSFYDIQHYTCINPYHYELRNLYETENDLYIKQIRSDLRKKSNTVSYPGVNVEDTINQVNYVPENRSLKMEFNNVLLKCRDQFNEPIKNLTLAENNVTNTNSSDKAIGKVTKLDINNVNTPFCSLNKKVGDETSKGLPINHTKCEHINADSREKILLKHRSQENFTKSHHISLAPKNAEYRTHSDLKSSVINEDSCKKNYYTENSMQNSYNNKAGNYFHAHNQPSASFTTNLKSSDNYLNNNNNGNIRQMSSFIPHQYVYPRCEIGMEMIQSTKINPTYENTGDVPQKLKVKGYFTIHPSFSMNGTLEDPYISRVPINSFQESKNLHGTNFISPVDCYRTIPYSLNVQNNYKDLEQQTLLQNSLPYFRMMQNQTNTFGNNVVGLNYTENQNNLEYGSNFIRNNPNNIACHANMYPLYHDNNSATKYDKKAQYNVPKANGVIESLQQQNSTFINQKKKQVHHKECLSPNLKNELKYHNAKQPELYARRRNVVNYQENTCCSCCNQNNIQPNANTLHSKSTKECDNTNYDHSHSFQRECIQQNSSTNQSIASKQRVQKKFDKYNSLQRKDIHPHLSTIRSKGGEQSADANYDHSHFSKNQTKNQLADYVYSPSSQIKIEKADKCLKYNNKETIEADIRLPYPRDYLMNATMVKTKKFIPKFNKTSNEMSSNTGVFETKCDRKGTKNNLIETDRVYTTSKQHNNHRYDSSSKYHPNIAPVILSCFSQQDVENPKIYNLKTQKFNNMATFDAQTALDLKSNNHESSNSVQPAKIKHDKRYHHLKFPNNDTLGNNELHKWTQDYKNIQNQITIGEKSISHNNNSGELIEKQDCLLINNNGNLQPKTTFYQRNLDNKCSKLNEENNSITFHKNHLIHIGTCSDCSQGVNHSTGFLNNIQCEHDQSPINNNSLRKVPTNNENLERNDYESNIDRDMNPQNLQKFDFTVENSSTKFDFSDSDDRLVTPSEVSSCNDSVTEGSMHGDDGPHIPKTDDVKKSYHIPRKIGKTINQENISCGITKSNNNVVSKCEQASLSFQERKRIGEPNIEESNNSWKNIFYNNLQKACILHHDKIKHNSLVAKSDIEDKTIETCNLYYDSNVQKPEKLFTTSSYYTDFSKVDAYSSSAQGSVDVGQMHIIMDLEARLLHPLNKKELSRENLAELKIKNASLICSNSFNKDSPVTKHLIEETTDLLTSISEIELVNTLNVTNIVVSEQLNDIEKSNHFENMHQCDKFNSNEMLRLDPLSDNLDVFPGRGIIVDSELKVSLHSSDVESVILMENKRKRNKDCNSISSFTPNTVSKMKEKCINSHRGLSEENYCNFLFYMEHGIGSIIDYCNRIIKVSTLFLKSNHAPWCKVACKTYGKELISPFLASNMKGPIVIHIGEQTRVSQMDVRIANNDVEVKDNLIINELQKLEKGILLKCSENGTVQLKIFGYQNIFIIGFAWNDRTNIYSKKKIHKLTSDLQVTVFNFNIFLRQIKILWKKLSETIKSVDIELSDALLFRKEKLKKFFAKIRKLAIMRISTSEMPQNYKNHIFNELPSYIEVEFLLGHQYMNLLMENLTCELLMNIDDEYLTGDY